MATAKILDIDLSRGNQQLIDLMYNKDAFEKHTCKKELAKGAFGTTCMLDNGKVMKIARPCNSDDPINENLCKSLGGNNHRLFLVNVSKKKKRLMVPNYISEGIVSAYCTSLVDNEYTLSYVKTHGIHVSRSKKSFAIVMEPLKPWVPNQSQEQVWYDLFLLSHALLVAQQKYKFTHYDLHAANVMIRTLPSSTKYLRVPLVHPVSGRTKWFLVKSRGYVPVIIDFGAARMTALNHVSVEPSYTTNLLGGTAQFHPVDDILTLVLSMYNPPDDALTSNKLVQNDQVKEINPYISLKHFLKILFGNKLTEKDIFYNVDYRNPVYRVDKGKSFMSAADTAVYKFAYYLGNKVHIKSDPQNAVLSFVPVSSTHMFKPMHRLMSSHEDLSFVDKGMSIAHYVYDSSSFSYMMDKVPYMPHTAPVDITKIKQCSLTPQYVHAAFLDLPALFHNKYAFRLECCAIRPEEYMKKRTGIVVNSGFFKVGSTFELIGPYKGIRMRTHHPFPKEVLSDLRHIVFSNKAQSITVHKTVPKNLGRQDYLLTSGPILVENGKLVLTLEKLAENPQKYQCAEMVKRRNGVGYTRYKRRGKICTAPINPASLQMVTPDKKNPKKNVHVRTGTEAPSDCEQINPGSFGHAATPNPRTVLVLRSKQAQRDGRGNAVLVVVEGRFARGVGMDLARLGQYCQEELGAETAINLDGGQSSQMVWRSVSNNPSTVYRHNTSSVGYKVPVLAIVKRH